MAQLEAGSLNVYGYAMSGQADGSPNVTAENLLSLLRSAIEHQVDKEKIDGISYPGLWTVEFYEGDHNTAPRLLLSAGLTENLVELSREGIEGSIYLEDAALYQLIRTMCDYHTSPNIDQDAYARYRDVVDDEFDAYFADADISTRWELTDFYLLHEYAPLGVEVYYAGRAYSSDPPEDILLHLAGGSYVDSQLRLHPVPGGLPVLLVMDGQAKGFCDYDQLPLRPNLKEPPESREAFLEAAGLA